MQFSIKKVNLMYSDVFKLTAVNTIKIFIIIKRVAAANFKVNTIPIPIYIQPYYIF